MTKVASMKDKAANQEDVASSTKSERISSCALPENESEPNKKAIATSKKVMATKKKRKNLLVTFKFFETPQAIEDAGGQRQKQRRRGKKRDR